MNIHIINPVWVCLVSLLFKFQVLPLFFPLWMSVWNVHRGKKSLWCVLQGEHLQNIIFLSFYTVVKHCILLHKLLLNISSTKHFQTFSPFPSGRALTEQHGQHWWDHPVCQGDAEPEAQQVHAEGLHTGLLSGHARSDRQCGRNTPTAFFGAGEAGGLTSTVDRGGKDEERQEAGVECYLSSPWSFGRVWESSKGRAPERLCQPLICFLNISFNADGHCYTAGGKWNHHVNMCLFSFL